MKLTGPYYRIRSDQGTLFVPAPYISDLRVVVGKLSECARVQPQSYLDGIIASQGKIEGRLFPNSTNNWYVMLRILTDGFFMPHWFTANELSALNEALNAQPLPCERQWLDWP